MFLKNSFDNSQEIRRSLDCVLTVCRAIKAVQRLNQIIMKSALWLWQIYHIRWHTLTRSDPTRPDQAARGGEGTKLEPSAEIVGANLGNMVKFQLGVSKAFTAVGRTYTVRIHNNHTEVCPIYSSICLSARRWYAAAADLLVGSSWRWGVKFFTTNCVKIFEAQTSRWVRPTPNRTDVAYGERTKNQFLMTATATTV